MSNAEKEAGKVHVTMALVYEEEREKMLARARAKSAERALAKSRKENTGLRRALLAKLWCASVHTNGRLCIYVAHSRNLEHGYAAYNDRIVSWATKDQDHDATKAREDEMIKQAVEAAREKE